MDTQSELNRREIAQRIRMIVAIQDVLFSLELHEDQWHQNKDKVDKYIHRMMVIKMKERRDLLIKNVEGKITYLLRDDNERNEIEVKGITSE